MNGAHFHLIVNHLPVVGSFFAVLALLWAIWRKDANSAAFGMICLVLLGLGAGASYLSGELAEDEVENISTVSHPYIEKHEDTALTALIAAAAGGVVGLVGLVLRAKVARWSVPLGLVLALVATGFMAWTANLGGRIRHTEIRPAGEARIAPATNEHDGDKD